MSNARAGREGRRGSGAIDAAVVRAALCVRIRTLGESILAIARTATEEVAALEREYAEAQATRRYKRRSPPRSTSPFTGAPHGKSSRTSKAASVPPAAGRASAASPEPASIITPRGRSAPRPQGSPATAKKPKSRKSLTPPCEELAAPATGTAGKRGSKQARPSIKPNAATTTVNGTDAETGGSGTVLEDPSVETERGCSRVCEDVAALCAAAEANFESLRAEWRTLDEEGDAGVAEAEAEDSAVLRRAPLYDRSNAAIVAPHGARQTTNGDSGDAVPISNVVTAGGAASLTARAAAGAPAVPLPAQAERQALADLLIVPDQSTSPGHARANASASVKAPATHTPAATPIDPLTEDAVVTPMRSYYNVVYIHQSTRRPRAGGPADGSDSDGTRAGQTPTPSPTAMHLGGTLAQPAADAAREAPLLIQSYVSAVYAAEHRRGRTSANLTSTSPTRSGDTALVTLSLRLPTSTCPGGIGSPVVPCASDPTTSYPSLVMTPVSVKMLSSRSAATSTAVSASRAAPTGVRRGSSSEAEVDARIESIEDWQRDRHAYVEDRIRRRRRSSLVSGAWQGEYYCSAAAAASKLSLSPPSGAAVLSTAQTAATAALRQQASVLPRVVAVPTALTSPPEPQCVDEDGAVAQVPPGATPYYVVDAAVPMDRATTYAVLLQAGSAAPLSPTTASPAERHTTPTTATASAGGTPVATAKAAARCPRLEVVVASAYNAVEWAFAGAARRASVTAGALGAGRSPVVCASPLWVAHQRRERELEEQRRHNAGTRQPRGVDISAPISVEVQV